MATLTIRDVDEDLKSRLRVRAAHHGRSMEAEVRALLRDALADEDEAPLGSRIHARFAGRRGVDLELPARTERPRFPDLLR
jgi:Plasmid stability protein